MATLAELHMVVEAQERAVRSLKDPLRTWRWLEQDLISSGTRSLLRALDQRDALLASAIHAAAEASLESSRVDVAVHKDLLNAGFGVTNFSEVRRQLDRLDQAEQIRRNIDAPVERFLRESNLPPFDQWVEVSFPAREALVAAHRILNTLPSLPTLKFSKPDELTSDIFKAFDGDDEARARLAHRIVRAWKSHQNRDDTAIRIVLETRAQSQASCPRDVLLQEVLAALILVIPTRIQNQRIRLGNRWVTNENGECLSPMDLAVSDLWRWLRSRVIAEARQSLLDFTSFMPRRLTIPLDALSLRVTACPSANDPLDILLISESLAETWMAATPAEQRLLAYIRSGHEPEEAAMLMGKSYSTIRQQLHRLRKRMATKSHTQ